MSKLKKSILKSFKISKIDGDRREKNMRRKKTNKERKSIDCYRSKGKKRESGE